MFGKACIGNATLDVQKVLHVKRMLVAGYSRQDIADAYEVGKETIARIDRGESWAHVMLEGEVEMRGGRAAIVPVLGEAPGVPIVPAGMRMLTKEEAAASAGRVAAAAAKPQVDEVTQEVLEKAHLFNTMPGARAEIPSELDPFEN